MGCCFGSAMGHASRESGRSRACEKSRSETAMHRVHSRHCPACVAARAVGNSESPLIWLQNASASALSAPCCACSSAARPQPSPSHSCQQPRTRQRRVPPGLVSLVRTGQVSCSRSINPCGRPAFLKYHTQHQNTVGCSSLSRIAVAGSGSATVASESPQCASSASNSLASV